MYIELCIGVIALGWAMFLNMHPFCKKRRRQMATFNPIRFKLFVTICALVNIVAFVYLRFAAKEIWLKSNVRKWLK